MVVKSDLESLVTELENWVKTQPHLPQVMDKPLLKRFIFSMYGDLDGAKKLLEVNYKMRNKYPQIFLDRDPADESTKQLLEVADLVPLPGLTPEKSKLLFYRLIDYNAEKFNFTSGIKVFFMMADCRFALDDEAGLSEGEVPIFDMAGFSLRHLAKTVISSLRIYMKFVQEAHPVRLKEIHVLNCPSYLDKVLMVVKPFIKSEVFKLIRFHLPNSDTPFKYFPQEMLPDEYGGKAGKMSDMKKQWTQILNEKRDYLMDPKRWVIDKSLKPKHNESVQNVSLCRNLEKLEID